MSEPVRIAALLQAATEEVIRRISINVTAELIERTPVDTGWARANWIPAIGTAPDDEVAELDRAGRVAGVTSARGWQSIGTASLTGYRLDRGNVFISNGVPYIGLLNDGTSDQAPKGFVQDAIVAGIRSIGRGVIG